MNELELTCTYHPNRPTSLRCNRCGQPICSQCAVRTPVGYRCKTCVREQQKIFETANWYDFPVAFVVSAVICGAGSILSSFVGFFILLAAGFVGSFAARIVQWAVRHRRSRYLWLAAAAGGIIGCLPIMVPTVVLMILSAGQDLGSVLLGAGMGLLWPAGYMIIAVSFLVANIRGFRL
ncbi:MAG: hypothetical protein A3K46_00935 [Chloroflexi bacterium RBG_13_60_9]|nr:MAG: hypothetical protein A3K46_00935 [Chloroflexi bacterium RBG_13_60_9]